MEICHPSHQAPRHDKACEYALKGLEIAEITKDPFHLHNMHVLVAYWKLTSAYKKPWSLREVRNHVKKADAYKAECTAYVVELDFHRSMQTRMNVRAALKSVHEQENCPPDDEILTTPATLTPFESAVMDPNSFLDIKGLDKIQKAGKLFQCANCRRTIGVLLSCAQCGEASYCDRNCQRKHWKREHKKECKKMKNKKS
jgi:hypothetical protein